MGQFMAALRKAGGMTQQEVADRLGVSNKAVSRWERDECAPDLSLIPAIAELFGVTCDELLKGERIFRDEREKSEPKVEKQLRNLIRRTLSGFKTLIWISLLISAIGLVCMLGISYGFYRPVVGFAVMVIFEVCAFVVAALAVSRTRDAKADNELFEEADEAQAKQFNDTLAAYSFAAFFAVAAVVLLSLPLLVLSDAYSVLNFGGYLWLGVCPAAVILGVIWVGCRGRYRAWLAGQPYVKPERCADPRVRLLDRLQLGAAVLAAALFMLAPYLDHYDSSAGTIGINLVGLALLLADIIVFIVFLVKYKDSRGALVLPGIRNALLAVPALRCAGVDYVVYSSDFGSRPIKSVSWDAYAFLRVVALTAVICAVFWLLGWWRKRRG